MSSSINDLKTEAGGSFSISEKNNNTINQTITADDPSRDTNHATEKWENAENFCSIQIEERDSFVVQVDLEMRGNKVKDLLLDKTVNKNGNFIHLICAKPSKDLELLLDIFKYTSSVYGFETVFGMFRATNAFGQNVLNVILTYQKPQVFSKTWKWLLEEFKKPDAGLSTSCKNTITFQVETTNSQECKRTQTLTDLILSVAETHPNFLMFLNILHINELDLVFLKQIIRIIAKNIPEVTRGILLRSDKEENPIIVHIAKNHELAELIDFLSWIQEEVSVSYLFMASWKRNLNGKSFMDQIKEQPIMYEGIVRWRKNNGKQNTLDDLKREIQRFLNFEDEDCEILGYMIQYFNDRREFFYIFRILFSIFNKEEMKKVMLCTINDGTAILFLVLQHGNSKLNSLMEFLLTQFDKNEFRQMLLHSNESDNTILHLLIESMPRESIFVFFNFFLTHCGSDFTQELILTKNKLDYNCLQVLSYRNQKISILEFLMFIQDRCSVDFVELLVEEVDLRDHSIFHFINENGNLSSLMKLLSVLRSQFGSEYLRKILYLRARSNFKTFFDHIMTNWINKTVKDRVEEFMENLEYV